MGTLVQDLKYGLWMLAKTPGFTAVAVMRGVRPSSHFPPLPYWGART